MLAVYGMKICAATLAQSLLAQTYLWHLLLMGAVHKSLATTLGIHDHRAFYGSSFPPSIPFRQLTRSWQHMLDTHRVV
jgi:hypothetical protein